MEFLKIREPCVYLKNLEEVKSFMKLYQGFRQFLTSKQTHLFRVGESVLLFFNPDDSKTKVSPPAHYGGGKQHFAFEKKEGYEKTKTEIKTQAKIIDTVTWNDGVESFYFEDPAGNVLEIIPEKGIWD